MELTTDIKMFRKNKSIDNLSYNYKDFITREKDKL